MVENMDNQRFALNAGRQRPPYKPKDIHCKNCGAGLTVKDERSELIVCDYCGSHLDVSKEEQKLLSGGVGKKWEFPLEIGDSYYYKKARYEIIARMAFIEDGDYSELSRQYLLYHPLRGTLWLDEYKLQYSLSTDTHVMPTSDPFSRNRGDQLETYDERKWICEGTGVYELVYVDGSLPWIATVGDQIQYAEFSEKSGSLQQYEAQRIKNEVEYGTGWAVPLDKVREATGKPDLHEGETATLQPTAAKKKKVFKTVFMFAIAAIIVNLALALFCITRGDLVMRQFFSPRELNGETISKPFTVREKNEIIKIEAVAPQLSNAWMYLNWAIVRNEDRVLHVNDTNISYYHGYSGGEHWTEGSQSRSEYIKIPEPGTYQLLVHGVSNRGNTNTAQTARHGVQLSVYTGAMLSRYFFIAMVFSIFSLFFLVIIYSAWKGGDEDED